MLVGLPEPRRRQPSNPADCKSPPLSGRALVSPLLRKGKNKILPAPGPAHQSRGLAMQKRKGVFMPTGRRAPRPLPVPLPCPLVKGAFVMSPDWPEQTQNPP